MIAFRKFRDTDVSMIKSWFVDDTLGMKHLRTYARPEEYIHLIDYQDRFLFIAEKEGTPIGFFDLERDGDKGYFSIYVLPGERGQGIADEIFAAARETSILKDVAIFEVGVDDDNHASRALLEKWGFASMGPDADGMPIYQKVNK